MSSPLPKFNNPPVIETVLGVEFDALYNWQVPHFGLYWQQIRSNYPLSSEAPPLVSQVEKFGNERQMATQGFRLVQRPEFRCWFLNRQNSWLLQIQDTRFIHNWRKTETEYPNYQETRRRFEQEWERWLKFLDKEQINEPLVKQCEVTYVNHIDTNGQSLCLSDIFPFWTQKEGQQFLPQSEATIINLSYVIPPEKGRLYVIIQPIIRNEDAKEMLQITLTARGCPESSANSHILDWLDLGHEWIVRGFTELTSEKMHTVWERTQ